MYNLKKTVMNIIGRLTRDAEVRTLSNEKQVVNFSIATNESYRNKQGDRVEQTTYFDCAYWISPKVADFLTKGTLVELHGRVYTAAWMGKDGEPHAGLNFHASQIKVHSSGKRADNKAEQSKKAEKKAISISASKTSEEDEDLPF
jgi:single-strand DNA-binding protein